MIRLEPVSERTFKAVADMKLPPEQNRFVAPNVVSMAQAWLYYDEARPYAVCDGDDVVGFIMFDWDEGERTVGIWRFMIAPEHQHKGFGRSTLEAAVALARNSGKFDLLHLDYVPGNEVARGLYYSVGFRENGDIEDGEIIMTLPLTDTPRVGMLTADEDDLDDFTELVKSEKENGTYIPAELAKADLLRKAIENKRVKRFTLMGKTIGLSSGSELLVDSGHAEYIDEIKSKIFL